MTTSPELDDLGASQDGRRSLLRDLGWGLRQIGLYVVFMAGVALLPTGDGVARKDVELAGIFVVMGLIIGTVLGLLRSQAERGGYRGAAIAGGAAGAAVAVILVASIIIFGTPDTPLWQWPIVILFGVAVGSLLGLEVRLLKRAGERAEKGEPPLLNTVLRSHLPRWLWVTGRELLLLTTCVILVPALLGLILEFGGSVEISRSTFLQMVPLGAALYVMIIFGRALG